MKKVSLLLIMLFLMINSFAGNKIVTSQLSLTEINNLFTADVLQDYAINLPIYKVYKNSYTTEDEYLVLCESMDEKNSKDTINKSVQAFLFTKGGAGLELQWKINDNIIKSATEETSIWFWTRYLDFQDFDQDGQIDYTLIYGTKGMNGFSDGRIKILMVNKLGNKLFIRHQNGVLDFERETKIDKDFYNLPKTWQMAIKKRMELLEKENKAIFPVGWKLGLSKFKTVLNERKK
jgi:hypothetical protein